MSYGTIQIEKMTTESGYSLGAGNASSFKNRLINGGMTIDQRYAGTLVSNANGYITDRWTMAKYSSGAGAYSGQQVTDAPAGFNNSLKVTVTTNESSQPTDAYWQVFQRGEGYNFADLGFGTSSPKQITVSFWVKSSIAGTYSASIFNDGFGGGNRNYVTTYTINSANTWEYKSFTLTGDGASGAGYWSTTNGTSVCLFFDMGSGVNQTTSSPNTWTTENTRRVSGTVRLMATSGATWQVTGVQLEVGTVATSFDFRSYGTELALCQRYFVRMIDPPLRGVAGGVTDASRVTCSLPVQMRSSPTATVTQVGGTGQSRFFDGVVSSGAISAINTTYSTTQRIEFDILTTANTYTIGRPMCLYIDAAGNYSSAFNITAEL